MKKFKLTSRQRIPHKRTVLDGFTFDSLDEARRYKELKLIRMSNPDRVQNLVVHPRFVIIPKFTHKATGVAYRQSCYSPDFMYTNEDGRTIVEEVKSSHSAKERDYQLRKRILLFKNMDIHFREIIYS